MANDSDRPISHILLPILGGSLFVFLLFLMTRSWELEKGNPLLGLKAPELEYETPDGKQSKLSKQGGAAIMLNFWATWCQPCMDEMPDLKALENHFQNKGFLLLAINIQDTSAEDMRGKIASEKMPQNLIFNINKRSLEMYDLRGIPLSVLIDKKGIIRRVYDGPRNWVTPEMLNEIEKVVNEP